MGIEGFTTETIKALDFNPGPQALTTRDLPKSPAPSLPPFPLQFKGTSILPVSKQDALPL